MIHEGQPVDVAIVLEKSGDGTKYNLIGHDIYCDGSVGCIKSNFGTFTDPIDAMIQQQIMGDLLLMVEAAKWTPEKWADVKAKVREQVNANTDAAKKLRQHLGMEVNPATSSG